jgi:outer membrane receptor protein involved in Fe transport
VITTVLVLWAALLGQPQPASLSGVVVDATGAAVRGALVQTTGEGATDETTSGDDGSWTIAFANSPHRVTVRVTAPGFAAIERDITIPAASPLRFELQPVGIAERVTVTAETPTRLAVESSATALDSQTLVDAPALMLDDQLRSVPGFSLFRRTSSRVANPTTQGVTLRGMSASGASRTLVLADGVPLNDPFGAWVYWDRVPVAALDRVDVIRGGSSDLHGNEALGGVIRVRTRTSPGVELRLDGGSQSTARASGYAGVSNGSWTAGVAAEAGTTDGYIVVAPEARGPIDIPADSRSTSAVGWVIASHGFTEAAIRGGYFTEDRNNGTPAQINATISRWGSAAAHGLLGGGAWEATGDYTRGNYRQTFSAVTGANRTGERLTNLQWVQPSGGGFSADWLRAAGNATGLVSVSARSTHATLDEAAFSLTGVLGPTNRTRAAQTNVGVTLQGRYEASSLVTFDGGVRIEHATSDNLGVEGDDHGENFFAPRIGASFRLSPEQTVRVTWLTGFRMPTINELYRSFRVGNTLTLANADLGPETSWGPEVAYTLRQGRWSGRAIFYVTRLNGAVYNRTVSSTPALIQRIRTNGEVRAIGSELELEARLSGVLSLTTSWALNNSTLTSGELDGKQVPQVPHVQGTIGLRAIKSRFTGSVNFRVVGQQYDDDRNDFLLAGGSITDARAAWRLAKEFEVFGAIENAFDEDLDTGRTPIRTIGQPRTARVGINLRF